MKTSFKYGDQRDLIASRVRQYLTDGNKFTPKYYKPKNLPRFEGGADMNSVRYQLYKAGVFNTMDPKATINKEQLLNFYNDYKQKNPNNPYLRGIENYGIDQSVYLLNNTASHNKRGFARSNNRYLS